ncbi:MAG: FHA domain-containing protein, partial [Pseudomonadota bacterium]
DEEDDFDGPVPSTAVSEAIAIANGEIELEEEDESDPDDAAISEQLKGFAGADDRVVETTGQVAEPEDFVNVASAISTVGASRSGRSAGRVKTRLLGFQPGDEAEKDIFEAAKEQAGPNAADFPVGWIIVIEGPGRGKCFTLYNGASSIGRGEDQAVRLDFGDNSISRNNHAAVAFDDEAGTFFLGHGGKSNLVRLNGKPVLSTEELSKGDEIRIGETTLMFMPLCGDDFSWNEDNQEDQDDNE